MAFATCAATAFERHRPLPVDAMVPDPFFTSTHAITIDAAPDEVWPWIAQMGAGRAGWYSWDAIDNGGTLSAGRVVPELQTVVPGDVMPAVPRATDAFVVASVDPPRDLVLTVPDGLGGNAVAWEHVLDPIPGGRTRLIVRGRASARWLDLARAQPPAGHHRIFIERADALLARLPRPLLIGVATFGHRVMEVRHLRGIQRRSTASGRQGGSAERWRQALLTCGILAPVLYVAMTLFVGLLWEGYSVVSGVPSELSAIGAPTRPLWIWLGMVYAVLMIAFGWIVWTSAPPNRALRVVGALLMVYTVFGQFWPPMHQRGVLAAGGGTLTDTLHLVWAMITGFFFMLIVGFGAAALGQRFRVYSIVTIVIGLACGAVTGTYASQVQADLPTPWVGVWERISIATFMGWIAVLATALLRAPRGAATAVKRDPRCVPHRGAVMKNIKRVVTSSALAFGLTFFAPGNVLAHCDSLDGPVVKAAQRALETRNPSLVLIWVQADDEPEIRAAFEQTLIVRTLSPQAKQLADRYFLETVVRVHRAGEGASYTGLKPAGRDLGPAIPAADKALDEGSLSGVKTLLSKGLEDGLRRHFEAVVTAKNFKAGDVIAGREYVRSYVEFIHYVERLHEAIVMPAHGHVVESAAAAARR